ncbi:MAG: nitroreductase family protein [Paramuribaculum sp.]|nr:nitroreductase family protein [Bacteroides sp.]MDE6826440.1 nitroreductase family protein [Paramuribaculum sp.]MDE7470679.1 nitroreductase family protein [Paramuribaculum sp.]
MENQALDNILTRSSVRLFKPGVVIPQSDLTSILKAGMAAPSAVNRQPWSFVVVTDHALLKALADALPYAKMTAKASAAIIVCGDPERFLDGIDNTLWIQDLSAVSENILLASHALGYGGVWTCVYPHVEREKPVSEILGLPDGLIPFSLIPIGVPDRAPHIMDKWNPDRIHYNRW